MEKGSFFTFSYAINFLLTASEHEVNIAILFDVGNPGINYRYPTISNLVQEN